MSSWARAYRVREEKGGFDKLAAFYAERAAAGVSLIVTGGISLTLEVDWLYMLAS